LRIVWISSFSRGHIFAEPVKKKKKIREIRRECLREIQFR